MVGNPVIEVELLPEAGTPVPLPARSGDGQVSGKEEECTAVSQRLVHQMKVAVRAAKQDARSVHIRFDRARSRRHTERTRPGQNGEIRGAFAPGWQRKGKAGGVRSSR